MPMTWLSKCFFHTCKVCRETLLALEEIKNGGMEQLTRQSFTNIRDFIMCEILIVNGHRSGVLANATLTEYYKNYMKDGLYVIKVHKHKTFGNHGAARIVIWPKVFNWLEAYVLHIRPKIATLPQASDKLFVSWNGGALSSGNNLLSAIPPVFHNFRVGYHRMLVVLIITYAASLSQQS